MSDTKFKKRPKNSPLPTWFEGPYPAQWIAGFYIPGQSWDRYPRQDGMIIIPAPQVIRVAVEVGREILAYEIRDGNILVDADDVRAAQEQEENEAEDRDVIDIMLRESREEQDQRELEEVLAEALARRRALKI